MDKRLNIATQIQALAVGGVGVLGWVAASVLLLLSLGRQGQVSGVAVPVIILGLAASVMAIVRRGGWVGVVVAIAFIHLTLAVAAGIGAIESVGLPTGAALALFLVTAVAWLAGNLFQTLSGEQQPPDQPTLVGYAATILFGAGLIAVIAPLSMFLTVAAVNAEIETATPYGWAVGLVFAFVLAAFPIRVLARSGRMSRPHLVILYCMLSLAVPVMNIGVVRQTVASALPAMQEYLVGGTNTYRVAYNSLDEDWFPKVPTREGMAYLKAERLLTLLNDPKADKQRDKARREIVTAVALGIDRMRRGEPARDEQTPDLAKLVDRLGVDQIASIQAKYAGDEPAEKAMAELGLPSLLEDKQNEAQAQSAEAAAALPDRLERIDEYAVSLIPEKLEAFTQSERQRVKADLRRLPEDRRNQLEADRDWLLESVNGTPRWHQLRDQVDHLSESDRQLVREALREQYRAEFAKLDKQAFNERRASFAYRLTRGEREAAMRLGLEFGEPDENLLAMQASLWPDQQAQQEKQRQTLAENLTHVRSELPWRIWLRPLISRGVLLLVIFLFLMCVAEWLRRKWIERENLAFPLVEIADHLIRHDAELETATDNRFPTRRRLGVDTVLLVGMLIGFVILSLEALGHYGFTSEQYVMTFDVSGTVLTQGVFREMNKIFFVLSPIIIGIAFLISLELSFSIWVTFLLFSVIGGVAKQANIAQFGSSNMLGWGGGKSFPYPQEQMLGAVICFTLFVLWKSLRTSGGRGEDGPGGQFVPQRLMVLGLIVLPVALVMLFWDIGIGGVGGTVLVVLFLLFIFAQVIAGARARAEAGFPTEPFTYEFTKMPILFGLTGFTGGTAFARFSSMVFLPVTMVFQSLAQMLENIELARRNRLRYSVLAVAGLVAFLVALIVGTYSFMLLSHYLGGEGWAQWDPKNQGRPLYGLLAYPLWVSHFLGEEGLGSFTRPHWDRIYFVITGFVVVAVLTVLRSRFLKFPLHPLGYIIVLLTIVYAWTDPYIQGQGGPGSSTDTTWIWGGVFIAWLIKKLIIKYGGMNSYKRSKPLFIGLVLGSVLCIFGWNMLDLICSLIAANAEGDPNAFIKQFVETYPYTPSFY